MSDCPDRLAATARAAVEARDWAAARTAFEALLGQESDPEALAGLGDALWWLGETEEAVRYQQQAYAAFRHRGDAANSAMAALGLYLVYRASLGNVVAARGWLARAARLVAEHHLAPIEGWVALLHAHDSANATAAARWAEDARAIATRFADGDLELCALSQLGAALVQQGRREEGTLLLDEAMAASLAGESTRPHTVVYVSCNLISACSQTADVDPALQWIRAADGFTERSGSAHLHTTCRTYLGAILVATGEWEAAERELRSALAAPTSTEPAVRAEAAARLAELRLAQGRLEEAERVLEGFEDFDASAPVLAGMAVARGEPAVAHRLAARHLRGQNQVERASYRAGLSTVLDQAVLWELLSEVAEGEEAEEAVRRLADLAARAGCELVEARACRAAGRLRRDVSSLESALGLFRRLGHPLEAGRTRLLMADLMSNEEALTESRAALATFERLGAARDADAAAARVRELGGVAVRGGPSSGTLTRREREVLELLGEGLSNRELAERLYLSRKTVERHVRNVLVKLGVRNRTEAAAYVVRHGAEMRSTDRGFLPMR